MRLLLVICYVSYANARFCPPCFFNPFDLCPFHQESPPPPPPPPPPPEIQCGENECPVKDMTECQKTCGNRLLTYNQGPCSAFTGCVCKEGYVRPYDDATGACIPVNSCPTIPQCGQNEEPTSCAQICPPQTCSSLYTSQCVSGECQPGCNCRADFLRDSNNVCIYKDQCPKPSAQCSPRCRPTCANPTVPADCPDTPYDPNDPCQCAPGYVLCEIRGQCIPIESCADNLGCNGDANAIISACPSMCPATCDSPSMDKSCCENCKLGCECKVGYILSELNGNCIRPDECPC